MNSITDFLFCLSVVAEKVTTPSGTVAGELSTKSQGFTLNY